MAENQFKFEGSLRIYDPHNASERRLLNSLSQEDIERQSPPIFWFKFKEIETILNMDEVDLLYGEGEELKFEFEPIPVSAIVEASPIITELARMGFTQTEEINFVANIPQFLEKVGREPISGDIFKISYFGYRENDKNINRFYKVSTVSPTDKVLGHYTNFLVNAEQTNMNDIPKSIIDQLVSDGEFVDYAKIKGQD